MARDSDEAEVQAEIEALFVAPPDAGEKKTKTKAKPKPKSKT